MSSESTVITPAIQVRNASDYSRLLRRVQAAGLLERSALGYLPRSAGLAVMAAGGAIAFVILGSSWWQLLVALWFSAIAAQVGFLGHDAGHQQIFRSRRWNVRVGTIVSAAGIGLSYGWWVDKHTRHHQGPNDPAIDPDVQRGALAWNTDQARAQPPILRAFTAHQAQLFFPLLLLEALNLHLSSIRAVLAHPRQRWTEGALLTVHAAAYLGVVFWWLPLPLAVVFLTVNQAALGLYLGCSFAPNHKGMPIPQNGAELDFLRRQVLPARNVAGGRALSAALGSLNYQIEHHLFPSMPSRNLARCRPLVRQFCAERNIPYCESGLFHSYATALRYLADVSRVAARSSTS